MGELSSLETFDEITATLANVFRDANKSYKTVREDIQRVLETVHLTAAEVSKYTFFDTEKPYTRNLVSTDGKHYTLLVLCWTPGKGSKIHNHPCDGCFIKTLSGCVKETKYDVDPKTGDIKQSCSKFCCEGQVSYMSDDLGLHKVENPCSHTGAVTLHLYTPPFRSCKVWSQAGVGELAKSEVGVVGFFSMYGRRTPNSEGKPGAHAKVLLELLQNVPRVTTTCTLPSLQ
jgi:cysteine dioxygenase